MSNPFDSISEGVQAVAGAITSPGKTRAQLAGQVLESGVQQAQAQSETNQIQAQHASIFVAGARPFLLWACGALFILGGIAVILPAYLILFGVNYTPEQLNALDQIVTGVQDYIEVPLYGMLGLGIARSWERAKGVARDIINTPKSLAKVERYRAETRAKYGPVSE